MRHWILSICFLISVNATFACGGWDPFGEDIRFSILNPRLYDDGGMSEFYYSANYLSEMYTHEPSSDRNVDDWAEIVGNEVSRDSIFTAIYRLSALEILDSKSTNPFVIKMLTKGRKAELEYLSFAKKYSHLNNQYSDPWERGAGNLGKDRAIAIGLAMRRAISATESVLKRRYAFLAIRMAFYHNDGDLATELYTKYFDGINELTIDSWAQYYHLHGVAATAERNFKLAQLFEIAPSKRHGIFVLFDRNIDVNKVIAAAKTNEEKANVWAMYTYREKGRQLEKISEIYQLDPSNGILPFLIVREVNKLEDWVLAPTYTAFAPVMRPGVNSWSSTDLMIKEAVESDISYAKVFLDWVKRNEMDNELKTGVVTMLQFIVGNPAAARETLRNGSFKNDELKAWQLRVLEMLNVAANENTQLESIDLSIYLAEDAKDREQLIFLMGRMFEFRNKLSEAAILYNGMNGSGYSWEWFVWAEPNGRAAYNISYYFDYFDYFDANYKAKDVEEILMLATTLSMKKGDLKTLADKILEDKQRLKDLIGTKYLRQNELTNAVAALKKVSTSYWTSEENSYDQYLAANPFYANFYSEHKKSVGDTVSYTKYGVVKELKRLIELAETQSGNAQAKTNFSIANCYFNMTTHGNSWMMRRSWWSANTYNTVYIDNDEFNKCLKAKEYYLKASEVATKDEFKAVCLRMAGRCESYKLYFEEEYNYDIDYKKLGGYREYMFSKNKYYKQLKEDYPEWRDELVTNCHSFNRFYHSI